MGLTGLLNSLARHLQLCCLDQARVVQKIDSAIYRINLYPGHKYQENQFHHPVDRDLSAIRLLNNWGQAITFASLYAAYTHKVLYSLPSSPFFKCVQFLQV